MPCLNQMNQYSIKIKLTKKSLRRFLNFFYFFIFFFAIAPNASPLGYAIQSEKEERLDVTKNVF